MIKMYLMGDDPDHCDRKECPEKLKPGTTGAIHFTGEMSPLASRSTRKEYPIVKVYCSIRCYSLDLA